MRTNKREFAVQLIRSAFRMRHMSTFMYGYHQIQRLWRIGNYVLPDSNKRINLNIKEVSYLKLKGYRYCYVLNPISMSFGSGNFIHSWWWLYIARPLNFNCITTVYYTGRCIYNTVTAATPALSYYNILTKCFFEHSFFFHQDFMRSQVLCINSSQQFLFLRMSLHPKW